VAQLRPRGLALGPFLALLLLSGCGYIGDPLPPLANIPGRVADLDVVQRGGRLIVHFTVPQRTTEGVAMRTPPHLELTIDGRMVPEPPVVKDVADYEIPTVEWTGKTVTITARAVGSNGKPGNWATPINLPIVAPPERPADVKQRSTPDGVELSWQGPPGDFVVLRRLANDKDFTQIGEAHENRYLDRSAEFGKQYVYQVQRIVKLAGGRAAQSELSANVSAAPLDKFAPAAPAGLVAVAAPKSVELTWEGNSEADMAGYRVYRAPAGSTAFVKVADVSLVPSFSDRNVESGKKYSYVVTAIDQAGNEGPRSAAVEASVD
jgi:fibronectin type 3 domain-containing protein